MEVVVATPAFDPALQAFQHRASQKGLNLQGENRRGRDGLRQADLRILHRGQLVSRWRWRETERLRYAALVFDDMGQDLTAARRLLELPCPLTFAVLPHLSHSRAVAEETHRAGREVMLHLPMQPLPNGEVNPGAGEIRVGMLPGQVARTLEVNLASVPHARGVNNHMGSLATADAGLMNAVMQSLARQGLYFVDSRTTGSSVALEAARRAGLPAFYRSVFLDGIQTEEYTLAQLREFVRILARQEAAIAIGHPFPTTIAALERFLPEFDRLDIRLVPVSRLLRQPEVAHLSPQGAAGR